MSSSTDTRRLQSYGNTETKASTEQELGLPPHIRNVDEARLAQEVNPDQFTEPHESSRFFVIKSYSEEDVHKAVKYSVWSSSAKNNYSINDAFNEAHADLPDKESPAFLDDQAMVYLFFSVNGSGHFCGVARLESNLKEDLNAGVWCSGKWTGLFYIRWLYVKDVPNPHLRHIRLPNNENKPVTNTRDGVEVDFENGRKVLKVIHNFKYTTTLFDDFHHYDLLEREKHMRQQHK